MINEDNTAERERRIQRIARAWTERAELAKRQGQQDVAEVAEQLALMYAELANKEGEQEPDVLAKANLLRKRIESTEQHRTMAAEHGLGNEAIDSTYEIQALEKELVELIRNWNTA